jgi:hypothetical protein
MNERIKQLADNATHYANGVCDADANADWYEIRDQKFAELIVRECGVALSPMLRDMVSRGQAYDLIKEHFGVKL